MKLIALVLSTALLGMIAFRFLQPREGIATNGAASADASELSSPPEPPVSMEIESTLGPIPHVNLGNEEEVGVIRNSLPTSSNNLVVDIGSSGEEVLLLEDNAESARLALEVELPTLFAETHPKTEWTNAGTHSISALISNYYWAMQLGDLRSWLECFSPREKSFWQSASRDRAEYLIAQFHKSLDQAQGFRVVSAEPFEPGEYLITLEMVHTGGVARERFVVVRVKDGWRISNECGELQHEYHASRINAYDLKHR